MARRFFFMMFLAICLFPACNKSGGGSDDPTAKLPLAAGIQITAIDLYQGVRLPIMADGDATAPDLAPIVGGKDGLLRVSVAPDASFSPRDLYLRIVLSDDDGDIVFAEKMEVAAAASTDIDLASTLNFDIPGEDLRHGQSISVSLREESEENAVDGDTSGAQWPSEGAQAVEIEEPMPMMKLVIVPVEYDADGSGRLPDTSDATIQRYEDLLMTMYPINGLDITVDAPLAWDTAVDADGGGWNTLLTAVTQRRNQNGASPDEYYFALVAPAANYGNYCGMGCVTGLSFQLTNIAPSNQAGIGIGFSENEGALVASTYTAAHEIGHLHGLGHVNATGTINNQCMSPDGPDLNYPYSTGSIGVMGYDPNDETLKDPDFYKDIMSYCQSVWMSDYMYSLIYDRIEAKNDASSASIMPPADGNTTWLTIVINPDGTLELGPTLESDLPIQGETREVALLDASGAVVETVEGAFIAYSDLGGGMVAFPAPSSDVAAARVEGLEPISIR